MCVGASARRHTELVEERPQMQRFLSGLGGRHDLGLARGERHHGLLLRDPRDGRLHEGEHPTRRRVFDRPVGVTHAVHARGGRLVPRSPTSECLSR
eukprot:3693095-Prymnesium_polylepis.2